MSFVSTVGLVAFTAAHDEVKGICHLASSSQDGS
jgi:hypothetical protein